MRSLSWKTFCRALAVLAVTGGLLMTASPAAVCAADDPVKGPIMAGGEIDYPPYSFLDENGQPTGFQVDLCRAIARVMGLAIDIRLTAWAEARKAIDRGAIDIIIGMFYTEERAKTYDFSPPYSINTTAVFARKKSPAISSLEDLRNRELIIMQGEVMHDRVVKQGLSDRLLLTKTPQAALQLLASGKGDYALVAQMPGYYWIKKLNLSTIVSAGPFLEHFENCFAVRRGNTLLLSKFTEGLAILKQTGEFQRIYQKWFDVLEPPDPLPLKFLTYAAAIVLVLMLLLAIIFAWSWSLRKRVARKTADLQTEITQHRQTEKALRESEERIRSIVDQAGDALLVTDSAGRFIDVNYFACKMLGYEKEELLDLSVPDVDPNYPMEKFIEITRCLEPNKYKTIESVHKRKDGSTYPVEIRLGKVRIDDTELIMALARDITIRKQAEEKMQLLSLAISQTRDLVTVTDLDGYTTYVNDAACRSHGKCADDLIGQHVSVYGAGSIKGESQADIIRKTINAGIWTGEAQNVLADGSISHLIYQIHLVKDAAGQPIALCGIGTDITKQQTALNALKESEQKFRVLVEQAAEMLFLHDTSGAIIEVNRAAEQHTGYSRTELAAMNVMDLDPDAEDRQDAQRLWRSIGKNDPPMIFETRHQRKDGSLYDAEVSLSKIVFADKELILGLARDISERKSMEKALNDSITLLNRVIDQSPLPIWISDAEGTLQRANPALKRIAGRSDEQMVGKYNILKDPYTEKLGMLPLVRRAFENGETVHFTSDWALSETQLADFACPYIDATLFPVFDSENNLTNVVSVWRELTEQKQAEQTRKRLETAIEQASEIIVITDTQGTIQYVNPAFEQLTGYTKKEALGQNPRILKSGQQDQAFYKNLWDTILGGKTWSGQFVNQKKDNSLYTEEAVISPVFSAGGSLINFVAVKRDITRDLERDAQILQMQKMEAIGILAGGIAHDFNNILSGIIGYTEVAQDDIAEGLPVNEHLEDILQLSSRARDLTQQILTFSRKTAQKSGPMLLQPVIKECLKMLRATLPRIIDLQQRINPDCCPVVADPVQMHQLMMNLCTNAADEMMTSGGTLAVEMDSVNLDRQLVSYDCTIEPGKYVSLQVRDSGKGIPRKNLKHIFDPFFTTKEKGKGTGMGLAVVYGIVRSHGGAVTVQSAPGKGTAFRVLLPCADAPAASRELPPVKLMHTGKESILFVDDENAIIETAHRLLSRLGYKVTAVQSPSQALTLFKSEPDAYNIVITDQTMPKMTGFDLARELLHLRPELPVILCTGFSEAVSKESARAAGITEFVTKPFNKDTLASIVRRVLDRKPGRRS